MRRLQFVDTEASLLEHSISDDEVPESHMDLLEQTSQLFSRFMDSNEEFKASTGIRERSKNFMAR